MGYADGGENLNLVLTLSPSRWPALISPYYFLCDESNDCRAGQQIRYSEIWNQPNGYNTNLLSKPVDDLDPCANLYLLTVTEFNFQQIAAHTGNITAAWNVTIPTTVGVVCALGYTVDLVDVTVNTANLNTSSGINTTGPLLRVVDVLPGYSYYNLSENVQDQILTNGLPVITNAGLRWRGLAQLLALMNGGSPEKLLNATTLKATAEKAFKGTAVQVADTTLRNSDDTRIIAELVYEDQRLQNRMLSVWAMGTGFVILALSTAAVLIWCPHNAVSRSPNIVAWHATILAASPLFQTTLEAAGSDSLSQLQARLKGSTIRSRLTNKTGVSELSVECAGPKENYHRPITGTDGISWWRPVSTTYWFMAVAFLLPLTIIVALEILQRTSNANDGLANISLTSIVDHSLQSILTSVVLILIAAMYDAVNFAAATLALYQKLARGSAAARLTLLSASSGDLPLWLTLRAIRNRHGSAAVASMATLVGSLLTVIGSGLYTIEFLPIASNVNILTSDMFVPSFDHSSDGMAATIFELIEQSNASYPPLTYDELAFPDLELSSLGADALKQLSDPGQQVTLHANIPAIRASLKCTLVPRNIMNRTTSGRVNDTDESNGGDPDPTGPSCFYTGLTFHASLPASCPHFLDNYGKTAIYIPFRRDVQPECYHDGDNAVVEMYEQVVLNTEFTVNDESFGSTLGAASNPPDCPSVAFLSAYYIANNTSTENFTAMTCIQGLEQVRTNTTFVISKDSIQVDSKPVVDESSALWLESFSDVYWFTEPETFASFKNRTSYAFGHFYVQFNYGPDGIPAKGLTGPANTQRFIDATQHIYRRYMARLISATMRQRLNSSEAGSAPFYPATLTKICFSRLRQNATSKLILQIFLGVMLTCAIFVYAWQDMRYVLPHCPWSIAGR